MIITIRTDGCRLAAEQPVIADGTVGVVRVRFCTDAFWSGLALSAVFRTHCGDILMPLTNGECDLPEDFLKVFEEYKSRTGARLTGILLDKGECFDFSLKRFADEVYRTSELEEDEIVCKVIQRYS